MTLVTFWFIVIAVLWTGFLVLEGFDFGVGMLHGVVGRGEAGRRVAIGTIGPLWDGNEVWLIVAAAGMFAAFPGWYATMFSGFYLAFLLLLVALIARGATFLALKTAGEVRERALRPARRVVPVTAVAVLGFAVWTLTMVDKGLLASLPEVVAVLAAAAAVWLVGRDRDWLAFVATAVTVAMVVVSIFVGLYPRVMVSTLGAATDLTVTNTASSSYSLRVMTVVAVVFLPVVLVYQAWTYYVFRRRIGRSDVSVAHATDAPPGSVAPG